MAMQNNKLKAYGFDLVTADEKVYYSLAADSEKELEDWMNVLGKAIGLDSEEHGTSKAHIHTYIHTLTYIVHVHHPTWALLCQIQYTCIFS